MVNKNSVVAALLLVTSASVFADWVKIGWANDIDGSRIIYSDPTSITRDGDWVTVWELEDFDTINTRQGKPCLSAKVQRTYHCVVGKYARRSPKAFTFNGKMGKGDIVQSFGVSNYDVPLEDTVPEKAMLYACRIGKTK